MTVIADISPIHYAVAIGIADALFALYGKLVVPTGVFEELRDDGAPAALRHWLQRNSQRIEVRSVSDTADPDVAHLDRGEREAILLAEQIGNSLLIIDERDGREEALRRRLRITGLLGVIRDAAHRGLIDFEDAIAKLKTADFRLSPAVEAIVREQYLAGR